MAFLKILIVLTSLHYAVPQHINSKAQLATLPQENCQFNGKKLYGKIQFVEFENQADITVQIVNSFPDLKVKFVENFASQCGEWQIVEHNANLKVYIAQTGADIKIQPVINFPGLP